MRSFLVPTCVVRLFTPDYVFATLANFVSMVGQQMLVTTLPLYVLSLGGSQADAGFVVGSLAFTALLLRPPIGWLTDTWQRRPVVLIGTSCSALASAVYLLAGSVPVLVLGRVLYGFGLCNYTTAANAYLADIVPPSRRAEGIGLFAAVADVGMISGPAIGFFVIAVLDFHRRVPSEQRGLAVSTYFLGLDSGISIGSIGLGLVSEAWGFGVLWSISAACVLLGLPGLLSKRPRPVRETAAL